MFISIYSFVTECLKYPNFEAYAIAILYHYRALNDLGFLNIGWLMGPSSVIIHLKSYLFICLEDSNILHLANLSNIFLWETAIEKICSTALENQHQKSPYALFKLLVWTGQYLAGCVLVHMAIYHAWKPVPPKQETHTAIFFSVQIWLWNTLPRWVSSILHVPIHIPLARPQTQSLIWVNYTLWWKICPSVLRTVKMYTSYVRNKKSIICKFSFS